MAETEKSKGRELLAERVLGTVKWFNVKNGYGFINRNDIKEDIFVHQSAITRNNPRKFVRSVGEGELVEFDVVAGEKGNEAINVTGPNGSAVKGSPYAADRRSFRGRWFPRRRRQLPPRQPRRGDDYNESYTQEGDMMRQGRRDVQRTRPFYRRYNPRRREPPKNTSQDNGRRWRQRDEEESDQMRAGQRRPPRWFYGRYYRRRPRPPQSDTEGSEGEGDIKDNEGGPQDMRGQPGGQRRRPPYRPRPRRLPPRGAPPRMRNSAAGDGRHERKASAGDDRKPSEKYVLTRQHTLGAGEPNPSADASTSNTSCESKEAEALSEGARGKESNDIKPVKVSEE